MENVKRVLEAQTNRGLQFDVKVIETKHSVRETEMAKRTSNALWYSGIRDLESLFLLDYRELLQLSSFGPGSLADLLLSLVSMDRTDDENFNRELGRWLNAIIKQLNRDREKGECARAIQSLQALDTDGRFRFEGGLISLA